MFPEMSKKGLSHTIIVFMCCCAGVALLYNYNPAEADFFLPCVFYSLTGLKCPGCGMQRAGHLLLHGRVSESFFMCPMLFFIPFVYLAMVLFPKATANVWFGVSVAVIVLCYACLRILAIVP